MVIDYADGVPIEVYEYIAGTDFIAPYNARKSKKPIYRDLVCAFDIETTRIPEINQAFMYIWQFQIADEYTIYGRYWEQFKDFIINLGFTCNSKQRIVCYVHNLAYEFQFLAGIYNFQPEQVFMLDTRRPAKVTMGCVEFRCSYIQTNMTLDAFTHKMGVPDAKLHDFDYEKIRYPWTPLFDDELAYCLNDVKGLVQAMTIQMLRDGDDVLTIPLTNTGYVRRDVKEALKTVSRNWLLDMQPDYATYKLLRRAFRGGNTHANRFIAGDILENVHSADRSSSYPGVQCNHNYPVSQFYHIRVAQTIEDAERYIYKRGKAVLMELRLTAVSLKNHFWGCPYLSRDKSYDIIKGRYDNGRILSADALTITCTDVDYRIIKEEYSFTAEVLDIYTARYGRIPQPVIDTIVKYYRLKTELKDVDESEYLYMKSKNKLNSIYGMTAQDPIKDEIIFENGEVDYAGKDPKELLAKRSRQAFIPYQWGVWCTAWARYELEQGIKLAHQKGAVFVYCDTDSVKYIGEIDWSKYNAEKVKLSTQSGAFATDPAGNTHYMEVYEDDGFYDRFKTLGAKKYVYETSGKLHITIAGVPKKKGCEELEEAGGIEAFKEGFIFRAGKLESIYNDSDYGDYETPDGKHLYISRNVALAPTTYQLGITAEYERLLSDEKLYMKSISHLAQLDKI